MARHLGHTPEPPLPVEKHFPGPLESTFHCSPLDSPPTRLLANMKGAQPGPAGSLSPGRCDRLCLSLDGPRACPTGPRRSVSRPPPEPPPSISASRVPGGGADAGRARLVSQRRGDWGPDEASSAAGSQEDGASLPEVPVFSGSLVIVPYPDFGFLALCLGSSLHSNFQATCTFNLGRSPQHLKPSQSPTFLS